MTDVDAIRRKLRNSYGLSDEDLDRILKDMSAIVLADLKPPEPAPQDFAGYVGARIGDAIRDVAMIVGGTLEDIRREAASRHEGGE